MVYGEKLAEELRTAFLEDLKDAEKIDPEKWRMRPIFKQMPERIARLLSPLL
jgi:cardiolipin synthase